MGRPKVYDDALRSRLLEQASELLAEHGPEALSLRRVAAAADTSTTAVYSFFGGKPGLLEAVYTEGFRRLADHLDRVEPTDEPIHDLVALGRAYRASALDSPHFYALMFGHDALSEQAGPDAQQRAARTFQPLLRGVERAITTGDFRPEEPATIATGLWASVHGLVSLELNNVLPPPAAEPAAVIDTLIRASVEGWRTTP